MSEEISYVRQVGIFDPSQFSHYGINIIGVGAIGSAVGLALAKLGMNRFTIWDNDKLERHNYPNQLYRMGYLGYDKVNLLSKLIGENLVRPIVTSFRRKLNKSCRLPYPIVFSCTDTISSRKMIYEVALKSGCKLIVDGRMAGKVFTILTIDLTDPKACKRYEKTFHADVGQSCTSRAIIYNILCIASLMVNQLTKVFQNKKYPFEINFCFENYTLLTKY